MSRRDLKNIFFQEHLWFLILLVGTAVILALHFLPYPYPVGHDIYFHLHASQEILNNRLYLPEVIPNYWGDFLFGYPFVFHWVMALLSAITHFPLITLFRWAPILLSLIVLILIYVLFYQYQKKFALIGTSLYVFLLGDLLWPIYSGEYPRIFSIILAMIGFIILLEFKKQGKVTLGVLSGLFLGLAMMSNMIAAIFVIPLMLYEAFEYFLSKVTLKGLAIPITAFLVSSIWWARATYLYGYAYFYHVLTIHSKASYTIFITAVVSLILAVYIHKTKKLPSIFAPWAILSIATQGVPFQGIPLVFYLSVGLQKLTEKIFNRHLNQVSFIGVILALLAMWIGTSGKFIYNDMYITPNVVQASRWIQHNTHPNESIIAYGSIDMTAFESVNKEVSTFVGMYRDETLPYFAHRNTFTWFGYEWSADEDRYPIYWDMHASLCASDFIAKGKKYKLYPDIIWINTQTREIQNPEYFCNDLVEPEFIKIYENEEIFLYRVNWDLINTYQSFADGLVSD